jgi:DNA-binding NarL/FixJ family response regulator
MALSILVVEDFEPWRRFVSSALQPELDIQAFLEASDGLEGVHKAEAFRPDIILLDVGLPTLNGIDAASRIRKVSPDSKILFLSEESSPEVAQAALEAGGAGYVVKSDAGRELLTAVKSLSGGKRYVSARLAGQVFFPGPDDDTHGDFSRHMYQVYSSDTSFLKGLTTFIADGLNAGDAVVVLATEARRLALVERLQTRGFNVEAITMCGSYISFDAQEALSAVIVDDQPDPEKLANLASKLVQTASRAPNGALRRIRICGECATLLWVQGKLSAALRMEELWDAVSHRHGLRTLCGYLSQNLQGQVGEQIFQAIRSLHSIDVPDEQRV